MKKVAVVINGSGGSVKRLSINEDKVIKAFKKYDVEAEVNIVKGEKIEEIVKKYKASNVDAIVAGGGDGTISSVAGMLINNKIPLAVLPLGTLNHFAKDIGMPLDFDNAVKSICHGKEGKVDLGEVNGNIFINNSSIGFYPKIVEDRDMQTKKFGSNKWIAMFVASLKVFSRFPIYKVRLEADTNSIKCKTPFIFLGNNEYSMNIFNPGVRKNINNGKLSLYLITSTNRIGMIKIAFAFLFNRLKQEKYFESMLVNEVWIDTHKKHVKVSKDGEVIKIDSPLHYKILRNKLSIILPTK